MYNIWPRNYPILKNKGLHSGSAGRSENLNIICCTFWNGQGIICFFYCFTYQHKRTSLQEYRRSSQAVIFRGCAQHAVVHTNTHAHLRKRLAPLKQNRRRTFSPRGCKRGGYYFLSYAAPAVQSPPSYEFSIRSLVLTRVLKFYSSQKMQTQLKKLSLQITVKSTHIFAFITTPARQSSLLSLLPHGRLFEDLFNVHLVLLQLGDQLRVVSFWILVQQRHAGGSVALGLEVGAVDVF